MQNHDSVCRDASYNLVWGTQLSLWPVVPIDFSLENR